MRMALVYAAATPLSAATLEVPGQYETIQAAINAADNGDTILVEPGVYSGTIVIKGKNVTLASRFHTTGNPDYILQTVIDGQNNSEAIEVDSNNDGMNYVVGITIRNADDGILASSPLSVLYSKITDTADAIDFESGSFGSIVRGTVISNNDDDAIDFDATSYGIVEHNILADNDDDGVEIRLPGEITNAPPSYIIRNNVITGNGEDGIQVIAYGGGPSNRSVIVKGNLIADNEMAGLALMCCDQTKESYAGSEHPERYLVHNNTFRNNNHAITGGDNMIVVNNVFVGHEVAIKRLRANSVAAHNIFHANTVNLLDAIADQSTNLFANPQLATDGSLLPGSPAVDMGITEYLWKGEQVLSLQKQDYTGNAPDLGAFEVNSNNPWDQPPYIPVGSNVAGSPAVRIRAPADSASFPTGTDITLSGIASDNEDGSLSSKLTWTSSSDGTIGSGATISTDLSAGSHKITAHVSDSDGLTAADTIDISVLGSGNTPPRLSILTPLSGYTVDAGLAVIFSGEATDREDGELSSDIYWESSLDGPIGTGATVSANLSLGAHAIKAEVYDKAGAANAAAVNIAVTVPDNSAPALSLITPAPGYLARNDEPIVFSAAASDTEDGDISQYVAWSSSIDGSLGTGATINTLLSAGNHTITATAADDRGATSVTSVNVRVESSASTELQQGVLIVRVDASADDAEENGRGDLSLISSDIEMTYDYGDQLIGLRFRGIDIPAGSIVDDAYIQFYADQSTSIATTLTIGAESTDDAPPFVAKRFNISSRKMTGNTVEWQPEPWSKDSAFGEKQRTPDLSKIIQEIVNRPNWSQGNAIAFLISGTGERVAESFDGNPAVAPMLYVSYRTANNAVSAEGTAPPAEEASFTGEGMTVRDSVNGNGHVAGN
jgi:hypothetical protein